MNARLYEGQTAIVTGAGAGMGRQHALLLATRGASVVVNDVAPTAEDVVAEIVDAGGTAIASRHDVSDIRQASEMVHAALDSFGTIQILVNNAAIIRKVPFSELTPDEFDRVMRVNAYGAFNVVKATWDLVQQAYGRIVMVSSASVFVSHPMIGHYAASKGAVLGLAQSLAAEGEAHGITVNVLAPGAFTGMSSSKKDPDDRRGMETMMSASLVAPVVGWLVRRENTLNGQIIEAAAGRAAVNFIGSTPGYWNRDLTIEDLIDHEPQIFARDGFTVLRSGAQHGEWMTRATTGWPKLLDGPSSDRL